MSYRSNNRRVYQESAGSGFLKGIMKFMLFAFIAYIVLSGGLWIVGLAFGLAVGFVSLLISLAPVLIVIWLVWVIVKALVV